MGVQRCPQSHQVLLVDTSLCRFWIRIDGMERMLHKKTKQDKRIHFDFWALFIFCMCLFGLNLLSLVCWFGSSSSSSSSFFILFFLVGPAFDLIWVHHPSTPLTPIRLIISKYPKNQKYQEQFFFAKINLWFIALFC